MSLTHAVFAIAGLLAAAGPVVIHLWNRRRYRTVHWGAMEFLSRAVGQTRRRVQLRDILVLLLRMLALVFFGLALARPLVATSGRSVLVLTALLGAIVLTIAGGAFLATARASRGSMIGAGLLGGGLAGLIALWQLPLIEESSTARLAGGGDPVHVIFVIDNSQSMATRLGKGTRLATARRRAIEAVSGLPSGSRVQIVPLCDAAGAEIVPIHHSLDAAREAIARIPQTDQAGTIPRMLARLAELAQSVPELPEKQAVFLTDLQASDWPTELTRAAVPSIPLQIVAVDQEPSPSNLFIASFSTRDGFVEFDAPAVFLASVAHIGSEPVENVEVALWFDDALVASETVDFQPGQQRSWRWRIPMNLAKESGQTVIKSARVTVRTGDDQDNRMTRDDAAYLAVPVVRALPVLFVDQYGKTEDLNAGRVGETYRLRRLLAPRPPEGIHDPFVKIRQGTFEELSEALLADVRLVVIAGVEAPTPEGTALLREFLEQGGTVLIAGGANFDPARWNDIAWRGGLGILPAPLAPTPHGVRPSQTTASDELIPRQLDVTSLRDPLFQIAGIADERLTDLWRQPFFFQVAEARTDESVREVVLETERRRIREHRADSGDTSPEWLDWRPDARDAGGPDSAAAANGTGEALARLPVVLARFGRVGNESRGTPYLIERWLGYGRVMFLAGGISSDWDTLAQTNAVILLDRIVHSLIGQTLPQRTIEAGAAISLPTEATSLTLTFPDGEIRKITADVAEGGDVARIDETSITGIYQLQPGTGEGASQGDAPPLLFAVNGPDSESDPRRLEPADLASVCQRFSWTAVGPDEPILLGGSAARFDWPWRWLIAMALSCLLLEMLILGESRFTRREEPS